MEPNNQNGGDRTDPPQFNISFRKFLKDLRAYVVHVFNFQDDVDKSGATENIKKDVDFQGYNVWILISSIIICSIGLNLNSTAVIIGAMLISPLMGPITGIGFAIATFDRDLWVRSIKNIFNAIVVSVLTSYLFFTIAPEGTNSSELLARTTPTILDLFVALFGGFAGILASTRSIRTNVIPGVAIATALMPPLCTAGYGLATHQYNFFFGALYLFFINSVFISLAALVIVRYLKFPTVTYVNKKVQRRVRIVLLMSVILVSIPSVIIYSKAIKKTVFQNRANRFVEQKILDNSHWLADPIITFNDTGNEVRLFIYGDEISPKQEDSLQKIMIRDYDLANTRLIIENMGSVGRARKQVEQIQGIVVNQDKILQNIQGQVLKQKEEINYLGDSIEQLHRHEIDLPSLMKEVKINYDCVDHLEYGNVSRLVDSLVITVPKFYVHWNTSCNAKNKKESYDKLNAWLNVKFKDVLDTLELEEVR